MVASAAFAGLASQVSMGKGVVLGSCLYSPTVADPRLLLAQVPAVRLSCLPVSPSHASMEASAALAQALWVPWPSPAIASR